MGRTKKNDNAAKVGADAQATPAAPAQSAPTQSAPALTLVEQMWQDALKAAKGDASTARYHYSLAFHGAVAMLMKAALDYGDKRLICKPTESAYSIQKNWEQVLESATYRRSNVASLMERVA